MITGGTPILGHLHLSLVLSTTKTNGPTQRPRHRLGRNPHAVAAHRSRSGQAPAPAETHLGGILCSAGGVQNVFFLNELSMKFSHDA